MLKNWFDFGGKYYKAIVVKSLQTHNSYSGIMNAGTAI